MAVQGLWRQGKDNVLYFNCGSVRLPPASLMIRTWLANALAMVLTPLVAWLAVTLGIVVFQNESKLIIFSIFLIILIIIWFNIGQDRFSTYFTIILWLILIVMAAVVLAHFFSIASITLVFGIVGAMYALGALMSYFGGYNPASGALILLMAICGVCLAIVINFFTGSAPSVWAMSIIAVPAWFMATYCKIRQLSELSLKRYASGFTTVPRCVALGGLMIYVSLLVVFCKILLFLFEAFCSLLGLFLRL